MIDPKLLLMYRRLAGRRDMNRRNKEAAHTEVAAIACEARVHAYQNAINDLCDSFQVTEDALSKQLETT